MRFHLLAAIVAISFQAHKWACAAEPASAPSATKIAADTQPPAEYVIGISPFLNNSVKDEVYRGIVRLIVEDLPLGSTLSVYDAFNLKSVTRVVLPTARAFNSPKTRANQFASAVGELKRFLAQLHQKPENARLHFVESIRLPQFCDFLGETLGGNSATVDVLLIGSPLYEDEKEPGFSMTEGYFPSDAHLNASREQTVYGFNGEDRTLRRPMVLHWVYFNDPWLSDLHKEKITRFWSSYLERRGRQLVSFCADLPTALKSFQKGSASERSAVKRWAAVDPDDHKLEMLRVGRNIEMADWLTRDSLPPQPQGPPATMAGPMKIGIRWKHEIDLDLYASPKPNAETLFFQHTRSPEGYYFKDHRSSPGREYEFIEFETPVDIREVEAFVNFYEGFCPDGPNGEVRIEFEGRIYSAPFSLTGRKGNRGRSNRTQQEYWTRIPVQQILKIAPTERAAR